MNRYKNDPRPLQTRFASKCSTCGKYLPKGSDAFYFPSNRKIFCESCGTHSYQDFIESAQDEEFYNSQYR
ncbi:MAG: hypothetical protein Q8J88_11335 [Bacteroidales bacterium]|nr:hypothetical protein [Bacteroidales bacterium]